MPPTLASTLAPAGSSAEDTAGVVKATGVLAPLGRSLFGIPMVIFGIQHYMYAPFVHTLMQPWMPVRPLWTYLAGNALLAAGVAITLAPVAVVGQLARLAATLLGVMILLFVLLVHIPQVGLAPDVPAQWTYLTQAFTFSGIALLVSGLMPTPGYWPRASFVSRLPMLGRWFVAIGFTILGARQLLQVPFVIGLVPDWYPALGFWAFLSGLLLLGTGIATMVERERIPAILLGVLLLVFLVFHHLARLMPHPYLADWGAACKDSILCGGVLVLASRAGFAARSLKT